MIMKKHEKKIIEDAIKIAERHNDELAMRLAEALDTKICLQNVHYFGAYLDGARAMLRKLQDHELINPKEKREKVYCDAQIQLILEDKHKTNLFLQGEQIRFRNHQKDKKGKLTKCEAYFALAKTVYEEIK